MKLFINEDFLLTNKSAVRLYHEFSEKLPIVDFHCHLSPAMIADDRQFKNLSEIWLDGDHYKWRAMRANGISEKYCTGNATAEEKFKRWAETVPATIGNPLYHWTHLELARYFNIKDLLSPATSSKIYERASELLQTKEFSTRSLIKKMNVELICTTDDPTDNLEYHLKLNHSFDIQVLPAFRPDNVIKTEDPEQFETYIRKLEMVSAIEINSFDNLISALDKRHQYFHDNGCRLSDHGLTRIFFNPYLPSELKDILNSLRKGKYISNDEAEKFRTAVMIELCKMNHKRGWVQQLHLGAIRNNNERLFKALGPDTGWDSIGESQDISKMAQFLSLLDKTDQLAKTILYNLNPADNAMMITMAGNFNDGSSIGKVQYGPAWWFLDQKTGIETHLKDISSFGLLKRFIGMVTDSRSFLSYPRHEYFRRLACNYIGKEIERGNIPDDEELIKPLVEGISYRNAKEFFGFDH
jgi:glucuronate isomerase